jgi:hypothetical protein
MGFSPQALPSPENNEVWIEESSGEILGRFDGKSGTVPDSLISYHEAFDDSTIDLLNDLQ